MEVQPELIGQPTQNGIRDLCPIDPRGSGSQTLLNPRPVDAEDSSIQIGVQTEEDCGVDQDTSLAPGLGASHRLATVHDKGVRQLIFETDR